MYEEDAQKMLLCGIFNKRENDAATIYGWIY